MSQDTADYRRDLSFIAFWHFVRRNWTVILLGVGIVTAAAVALAFLLPPKYRAEVVISPADSPSGLGQLSGQLGDLASLAGINLSGGGNRKSEEALEYMRSRIFPAGFITRHGLMPLWFAKNWYVRRAQWRATRCS